MIKYEDVYKIGKIGRPHGIKGEMLLMFSDDVFDTTDAQYLIIEVDGILVPFFIDEYRFRSDETALIKFLDIETKEQAQTLTNCAVYFPRQAAEENDHYSWSQLVGYEVRLGDGNAEHGKPVTVPGTASAEASLSTVPGASVAGSSVAAPPLPAPSVGVIAEIDMSTENYLFVLDNDILIPAVDEFIIDIDHQSKTITMNLPEGLI